MNQNDILLLKGNEIADLLDGREADLMNAVRDAYLVHKTGDSCLPHSSFVRFPNKEKERIIALPTYLGGKFNIAGMKWIASFPGNLARGMERASAQLILNSTETGRPLAFMESSIISAKRTAAGAALAGHVLRGNDTVGNIGLVGCGLINFETMRFLWAARPALKTVSVYDLSRERAEQFIRKCRELTGESVTYRTVDGIEPILAENQLIALATTAVTPYLDDLSACPKDTVILHTSLRDIQASVILEADNIVDDVDHALRARTSVHLAELEVGHRDFIRCEIADVFNGDSPLHPDPKKLRIFAPFGLGVLDLALAKLTYELALEQQKGTPIQDFVPDPWFNR
ncbi:MAG: 2,3-diaminopropionate biosynthesis protein SbnB [Acidobacteriota bacterium]|nr:2,3-diaminopropionate biosynthesis protein SbnB [Acidobacteriota bacterium]